MTNFFSRELGKAGSNPSSGGSAKFAGVLPGESQGAAKSSTDPGNGVGEPQAPQSPPRGRGAPGSAGRPVQRSDTDPGHGRGGASPRYRGAKGPSVQAIRSSMPGELATAAAAAVHAVMASVQQDTPAEVQAQQTPTTTEIKKVVLANRFIQKVKTKRQIAPESPGVYAGSSDERLLVEQELVKSAMLRSCNPSFVEELARAARFRKLSVGPVPASEAAVLASKFLLVLRGRVLLFISDRPVERLASGKHFGETLLLGLETRSRVEFSAEVNSTIAEFSRDDFLEVLKEFETERRWFQNIYKKNCGSACMTTGTLVNPCHIFTGLEQAVLRSMCDHMLRRIFFPGEKIIEEGQECSELFVIAWGSAGVEIAGRSVRYENAGVPAEDGGMGKLGRVFGASGMSFRPRRLSQGDEGEAAGPLTPSCFGELGLLGLQQQHSASVVAKTVCHVRVLHRSIYQHILREHSAEPSLDRLGAGSLAMRSPLKDMHIFREADCHPEFLEFLEAHLEMRLYAPKQQISYQDAQQERCLYIMTHGSALARRGKEQVGRVAAGEAFGAVLGVQVPAFAGASVKAEDTCYVCILHQGVIMRGLELFPDERKRLLLKAQPRRLSGHVTPSRRASGEPSAAPAPRRISIVAGVEKNAERMGLGVNADALAAAELAKLRDPGMRSAIMEVLNKSSFFADVSEEFVDEIASTSVDRIYMPGDRIIEEGQRGDSMFVMISGTAGIYVADPDICLDPDSKSQAMADTEGLCAIPAKTRVATLSPGGISGELAMLGVSPFRGATIQAETICSMWEISQDDGITFLERFPESRLHFRQVIVQHLERSVMARIIHLPLLQCFGRKFLTLVGLYCEREAYFPGDIIVREGQTGLKMYVINIGTARLFLKGVTVKTYGAGGIYGASVMFGIHKAYFGSLVALQTCHVVRVPRSSYQHALEQYPSKQAAKKLRKAEEAAEEEFRGAMQRVSARKLVWNRYQGSLHLHVGNLSQSELLKKTLDSWKTYLRQLRECRHKKQAELERSTKVIRDYVEKKKEQFERAQELALEREEAALPCRSHSSSPERSRGRLQQPGGGDGGSEGLPRIGQSRSPRTPAPGEELARLVGTWAAPKPSPFYELRVYNVLAKTIERPTIAGPLLPLLQEAGARQSPRAPARDGNMAAAEKPEPGARPAEAERGSGCEAAGGGDSPEKSVRLPMISPCNVCTQCAAENARAA